MIKTKSNNSIEKSRQYQKRIITMLENIKANILFNKLLGRPNIDRAYAMVDEKDSWYDTISTVHRSLAEIRELPHSTVEVKSFDGLTLRGIYYPAKDKSDVTVICVHGYTSHAEREWAFPGLFYHSLGYNVLIPYQRAHGLSEGKYISFGALESRDMLCWLDRVNEMTPDGQVIFHGLSMGGGIVLDLSDKDMKNVKALIADAPSVSIDAFFNNVSREVFKKDYERIAFLAKKRFKKEFGADVMEFESVEIVKNGRYPLLLAAGENENLGELFDRIKAANPKVTEIIILPGSNHGNGMYKQTERFQSGIKSFLSNSIK
jgi:pimeloyl-ACP methyl ester carboxylesterase